MSCLEVLGEAAIAVEPSERALDDPASGQQLEALGAVGSLDDLQRPRAECGQRGLQLGAGIAAVGEDVAQPGESVADRGEQRHCPGAVLDVGRAHAGRDQQPIGIGQDVALPAIDGRAVDPVRAAEPARPGGPVGIFLPAS